MKAGFFEEGQGQRSVTRLLTFIGILWTIVFTTAGTFTFKWGAGEIVAVFGGIIAPFVGLKLIQKPMEKKDEPGSGQ